MDQRKNRTTINISQETLNLLKDNLQYKKKDGKHFQETYDDLLMRLIKKHKEKNKPLD